MTSNAPDWCRSKEICLTKFQNFMMSKVEWDMGAPLAKMKFDNLNFGEWLKPFLVTVILIY